MSQLDFPRIHVRGLISINVDTANNDDYAGMTVVPTYDDNDQPEMAAYSKLPLRLADTDQVQADTFGQSDENFHHWASQKLEVFDGAGKKTEVVPAEWNFYGSMGTDMEFDYVDKDGNKGTSFVRVASLQVAPEKDVQTASDLEGLEAAVRSAAEPFLGATLSYKKRQEVRHSTAMMIDCSQEGSSQSSQIFADNLMLENNGKVLLSRKLDINGNYTGGGQPSKASTWWLDFQRNVNFGGPGGASGSFQTVVLFDDGLEAQALQKFFESCRAPGETRKILGVAFRYNIFRCQGQYRYDLDKLTELFEKGDVNPGVGEVVGTLAPWYEGDQVEGLTLGRVLLPSGSFKKPDGGGGNGPVFQLAPVVAKLHDGVDTLSLDVVTTFPENYQKKFNDPQSYDAYHDDTDPASTYNPKYDLGDLTLNLETPEKKTICLSKLTFTPSACSYGTERYYDFGGMLDIPLDFKEYSRDDLANGTLTIVSEKDGTLMTEDDLMVTTATPTLYTEQAPCATADRFVFDSQEEVPCGLAVYYKGKPITPEQYAGLAQQGKGLVVQEFNLNPLELQGTVNKDPIATANVDDLQWSLRSDVRRAGTRIFAVCRKDNPIVAQTDINTLLNPLIYLRILPNEDYSRYYVESTPGTEPVGNSTLTFGVIFEHVFRNYHLLYPIMSKMVPLNDPEEWAGPEMARRLLNRLDPSIWNSYEFMPRTRDLSRSRRELVEAWCRKIIHEAETGQPMPKMTVQNFKTK